MADAADEVGLVVDQRRDQLGRVHLPRAHGRELAPARVEVLLHELVGVVDAADRGQREHAEVTAHEQRLRVGVGDASDARVAVEAGKVTLEPRSKRRVLDRVNLALEAAVVVINQSRALRPQVRVVIHPEEHVIHHIALTRRAEKTAHCIPFANPSLYRKYTPNHVAFVFLGNYPTN